MQLKYELSLDILTFFSLNVLFNVIKQASCIYIVQKLKLKNNLILKLYTIGNRNNSNYLNASSSPGLLRLYKRRRLSAKITAFL